MKRVGRAVLGFVIVVLALVAVAATALFVVTGTNWGHERVRRYAEKALNGMAHGHATIGSVSGNLLVGMTVHDLAINDSAGHPFVSAQSFRAQYSVISLIKKHVWLDHAVLVRPVIVLDKPPNQPWNWQRIFPRDTTPKPASKQNGWADWIRATDASIENGQLIVRTPWAPSDRLKPSARDSVIRDAVEGKGRLAISRVAGGFQKTVHLDSVWASIPLLRLSEPGLKDRLLQVSSLRMDAFPFRSPGAVVHDLKGTFPFNNDSVWWHGAYAELPATKASGDGSYVLNTGDLTLHIHGDPASFADLQWIYPRLPNGGGKFDLALTWRGALQDYQFTNANVAVDRAHADGSFGITLGDTITIHNTNLRFAGVDTRTLAQLIPNFRSPRQGVFTGRATVSGGRHALAVNGDVTFDDARAGRSRIVAQGGIGFLDGGGVRANDLRLQMLPVQVDMARTWRPTLPIGGIIEGTATVNGSTNTELAAKVNIAQRDRGTVSAFDGTATIGLRGSKRVVVDLNTHPVSLVEVGRFFPAAGLQGSATGPIHANGTLGSLAVRSDLRLPDGGRFNAHGTLDLASAAKGYNLTATLYTLDLRTVDSKAPVTSLSAQVTAHGRGTQLATMQSSIAADFSASSLVRPGSTATVAQHTTDSTGKRSLAGSIVIPQTIAIDTGSVRVNIASGLATVNKLYVHASHASANVNGTFGLVGTKSGNLTYAVSTDSLGAFNQYLPRTPGDTVPVAPRPQVLARILGQARADSARIDRATEMQRLISGAPPPALVYTPPQPVPADTLSGKLAVNGTLNGNIDNFDLTGHAVGDRVTARGNFARSLRADVTWKSARTTASTISASASADSASIMGFAFDTVSAKLTYAKPGGHVEVAFTQADKRHYAASGDYAFYPDKKQLQLASMSFQFDTSSWTMPHASTIEWGGPGVRVTNFELRNKGNARLYANGLLPTSGVADFRLDVDSFPVTDVFDLLQSDLQVKGIATLHGNMKGTLTDPSFNGTFGFVQGQYNGIDVPNLNGRFDYANDRLNSHVDVVRANGQSMAVADAQLPINLALEGVTGDRLLPDPMSVNLVADSLPLDLIPQFTDVVSGVKGRAAGHLSMTGTLRRPALSGAFTIDHGATTITSTGATISNIVASAHMANDTVFVDSVAGSARGPVHLRGNIAVGSWRDPRMNLFLTSSAAQLMNNKWANIRVDAGLALTGPFNRSYLSGAITVVQGVIYAPEPTGRHLIGAGDPALYNVLDTSMVSERDLFPTPSPLLANLRVDVNVAVKRDTWVRNREANVEIYTDDPLFVHEEQEALSLTGVLNTDRGEYSFLSKRFEIQRGSAMFVGSPDLNPTLQITGDYQVQTPAPINISVQVGGTLKRPTLALESDAQPPKTQSELLSLLAFGQSTTSLLAFNSSSVAGSAATSDQFGVGAQLAARRLASVALGVAVDQVQLQAGKSLGTDFFDITPADVPFGGFGQQNGFSNFIEETKVEAGKYLNPRTFVSAQEQARQLGASIEYRRGDGWRFNATIEPRILLREPTLNSQPFVTRQVYGGFVIREWRF